MTLKWLRDGRPLTPAADLQISQHDSFSSSLILTHVRPSHTGNYTCEAENPARQVRYTAQLLVRGNVTSPGDLLPPLEGGGGGERSRTEHCNRTAPHLFYTVSLHHLSPLFSLLLRNHLLLTEVAPVVPALTWRVSTSSTEHSLARFLSPSDTWQLHPALI